MPASEAAGSRTTGKFPFDAFSVFRAPYHLRGPLVVLHLSWPYDRRSLKAAYRAAAKRTHPDLGGDAGTFRHVVNCYEALSRAIRC